MDLCGSKGGQVARDNWWGSCEERNEILRSTKFEKFASEGPLASQERRAQGVSTHAMYSISRSTEAGPWQRMARATDERRRHKRLPDHSSKTLVHKTVFVKEN